MGLDTVLVLRSMSAVVVSMAVFGVAGCQGEPFSSTTGQPGSGIEQPPGTDTVTVGDLEVWLDRVANQRPDVESGPRNPFRFRSEPTPEPPQVGTEVPPGGPEETSLTGGRIPQRPPGGPVALLEFVGLVDAPSSAGLIAVLTDGDVVFHGREGETVEGQYRIAKIGPNSVEIERLPAGGRQVLQLARP